MRRTARAGILAALALLAGAGAARAGSSEAAARKVRNLQMNLDRAFLWHFLHENQRIVHPAPGDIRSVGLKIVKATGRAFSNSSRFFVVDSSTVNAMSTPGANIFIYQGILDMDLTPGEKAALIAHEVAHVARAHWLERFERNVDAKLQAQYAARVYGANSAQVQYLYRSIQNLQYNREQEYDADALGAQLMTDAGYSVEEMLSLMGKVGGQGKKRGAARILSDHPDMGDRIARLEELIRAKTFKARRKRIF